MNRAPIFPRGFLGVAIMLLLLCSPAVASAQSANTGPAWLSDFINAAFGTDALKANLVARTATLRMIFTALAVPILVGGYVARWKKCQASGEYLETVMVYCLLVAFIASVQPMVNMSKGLGDGVAQASGFSNNDVAGKIWELQKSAFDSGMSAAASTVAEDENDSKSSWWNLVSDTFKSLWSAMLGFAKSAVLGVIAIFCSVLCFVMAFGYMIAEAVRTYLLQAGAVLLPVFIACLGTESFRNQGLRYILGLFSISMWPIGWLMGNLATVSLVDLTSQFIGQICAAALGSAAVATVSQVGIMVQAAKYLSFTVIIAIVVVMCIITLWSVIVLIFAPKIISKVIKDGAQMAGPLLGMQVQGAMAAGAAVVAVAAVAATAATGGAAAPVAAGGAAAAGGGAAAAGGGAAGGAAAGGAAAGAGGSAAAGGSARAATLAQRSWAAARKQLFTPGGALQNVSRALEVASSVHVGDEGHAVPGHYSSGIRRKGREASRGGS